MADERERLRRWRLLLGDPGSAALGAVSGDDEAIDGALNALYEPSERGGSRSAGLGDSAPKVARWLADIRTYFPSSVVQVMQADAIERLNLAQLLLEPEMLASVQPDVHLVGTLLSLHKAMPETAKATARQVVATVVAEVEKRIAQATRSAVAGALNRASRTHRPKLPDVDWSRTIQANLKHYQPAQRTVIPERLVGFGRRQKAVQRDVIVAIDESGSMAESVVYAGVFGAVLASIAALRTSVIAFDTNVVDLTGRLHDPVEVLFGTQLGGGTDINRAIAYAQTLISRPTETLFVLISDLYEGGVRAEMLRRIRAMTASGVQVVVLLALSDSGAPSYDRENAAALATLGVPAFACTPDAFPELLAEALSRGDLTGWAERYQLRSQ
ncbi:VWA domain-containing protein [Fodinicola acaciae]|uniref:VWA domain-containing protein n=1 Tax=Fodinicola acaciae TaxID=2681555 RepID=UPI0013D4E6F1|nr:VWA domain-containing protein [Fodinicola acaciae]